MKFKITAKKQNNEFVTHYFDNISLRIINENGIPVVLKEDPRCGKLLSMKKFENEKTKEAKSKEEVTCARITLGFNCNFHCKYCLEHEAYGNKDKIIPIHENLDSRAEFIVTKVLSNFPNLERVTFWGGEPFVYIKLMKKITKLFKERKPELFIGTITNGALLTLDAAKWIVENKISLTISHDGPAFNAYRDDKDPLDNPKVVEAIKYLYESEYKPTFNVVVTPENANLQEIAPFFESKLGFVPSFGFESIVKLDSHSEKIVSPFTEEDTKILLNNMVAYGSTPDNKHDYGKLRDIVTQTLKALANREPLHGIQCMIQDKNFVAIDTNCRVLVCHGSIHSYCNIDDVDKVDFPEVNSWQVKDGCWECPFLVSCLGGCPLIDGEDQKVQCRNLKIWASGIFIAAWKILFGATICKIEPVVEDQIADQN